MTVSNYQPNSCLVRNKIEVGDSVVSKSLAVVAAKLWSFAIYILFFSRKKEFNLLRRVCWALQHHLRCMNYSFAPANV